MLASGLLAPAGAAAATATPTFVQQASATRANVPPGGLGVTPAAGITAANRLIVMASVRSSSGAATRSVTDSAGNTYVKLLGQRTPDGAEVSVWTAPVTDGDGTRPTITVKPTSKATVGIAALEYAGLSTVADATIVDQFAMATGTTSTAATVSSGPTAALTADNDLVLGLYADSGAGVSLTADAEYSQRVNVSPNSVSQLLVEDRVLDWSATPNATVQTGAKATWLMATLALKAAVTDTAGVPGAPMFVTASAGDSSATVSWTAPPDNGSPITSYTVTPYVGTTPQTPTLVTGSPPATGTTVSGLTNGSTYTFKVSATNSIGTGPASDASNSITPTAAGEGEWSAPVDSPIVAVHAVLLKTGNLLMWDGWSAPQPTSLWNLVTQNWTTIMPHASIFCSGQAQMPDGRILVAGGHGSKTTGELGIVDTTIFDPSASTWTRVADMKHPRWYPGLTELADGRYVAISGNSTDGSTWADTPEVYDPSANTWTELTGVSTHQVHQDEYPLTYLVPGGEVFTVGPEGDVSYLLDVAAKTWTPVGGASGVLNGSSVMYRPGKVLYTGGARSLKTSYAAQTTAAAIDLSEQTPSWRSVAPMGKARVYHSLSMLADGKVLAWGGQPASGAAGDITVGVLPTEIWDPATNSWSAAAPLAKPRGYHSTGMLLPDARVLVAGGGHSNSNTGPGQFSSEIYSPPYLFKGARPTIESTPKSATYGSTVTISTPQASSIRSVNLVSLGAVTHQSDMSQHFVPLSFQAGASGLDVELPANAALAPPASYMLFIVDDKGVPSVASFISLAAPLRAPQAPTDVAATAADQSAKVTWTAPSDGGSPITSYTVTPYIGATAQTATTVTGAPPATSTTVTGLTNGSAYTFKVSATNAVGTGPQSSPSNVVTPSATTIPTFVQQASAQQLWVDTGGALTVTPASNVTAGNRIVVQTEMWSGAGATADSVTDTAGNTYTKLLSFKAPDQTEMSVWTASVTAGGGTRPTITVKPTSSASMGVAALEYSGLSTAAGTAVVDQLRTASGTTGSSGGTVASGATAATTAANDLVLGFYADSGFGVSVTADPDYTERVNTTPSAISDLLVEDRVVGLGTAPNATAQTGADTVWLMATLALKPG